MSKQTIFWVIILMTFSAIALQAEEAPFMEIIPQAETGFTSVLFHVYQSGSTESGNKSFDFVKQGGQDNLYPYARYSVEAVLAGQHRISFLYQPLTIETQTVAERNGTAAVQVGGVSFPAGTAIDLRYAFDFYRLSYLFDFADARQTILGAGLSFQLRNASISFTSVSGDKRTVQDNVGLVPIIKLRAAHWFGTSLGLDFEADGFYASSAIFNGAGRPFEGWIWDAGLQVKTRFMPKVVGFVAVRSIGGGASGSNAYDNIGATTSPANSFTYNSLATFNLSLGVVLE